MSVPISGTMEIITDTTISPLISKGYCKVCYVGQEANRNDTVITKEMATEMGRKLPGSPIVGYYNKEQGDFEGHNRELVMQNGKFEIVDVTRPYGFVPTNADVWFEKFDDEGVEHEYLCCTVYIWTGAYPESKRILDKGNNQSMELTKTQGFWANSDKSNARVFIYNEALIEKLCVLGESVEPCFEGAQIKSQFSLESSPEFQEFKATMFSMITELQETLSKGGSQGPMDNNEKILTPEVEEFEKKPKEEEGKGKDPKEGAKPEEKPNEDKKPEEKKPEDNEDKKKYNLEDVVEYTELMTEYEALKTKYEALEADKAALDTEVAGLREFKLLAERSSKQSMIDGFYMLSDEDKADVIANIDNYSLDDIEAKLSIICVRNKVSFSFENEDKEDNSNPQGLFNLAGAVETDNAPDWVKAVRHTANAQ